VEVCGVFVGDDWAEGHHDIEIMDAHGKKLCRTRFPEGVEGVQQLHALIADHADGARTRCRSGSRPIAGRG
jgi:hypothetical protein